MKYSRNCDFASYLLPHTSYSCAPGWEEGGDDAKSAWPSDTLGYTRVTIASTTGRNTVRWSKPLEKMRQFGLRSATRPHEAGIASNRRSAILRWIRSQVLYSPPVNPRESEVPKISPRAGLRQIRWQGVSRNKARVAEAARGIFQNFNVAVFDSQLIVDLFDVNRNGVIALHLQRERLVGEDTRHTWALSIEMLMDERNKIKSIMPSVSWRRLTKNRQKWWFFVIGIPRVGLGNSCIWLLYLYVTRY